MSNKLEKIKGKIELLLEDETRAIDSYNETMSQVALSDDYMLGDLSELEDNLRISHGFILALDSVLDMIDQVESD